MKIGFVGLGSMGRGMAANLIKAGHEVIVWNRSAGPADALAQSGARVAGTPLDMATVEVLHSMLANDQAVRETLVQSGLLAALAPTAVHVNHATVSVALTGELAALHAAHGSGYVAAPVFGRPDVAAAGKLNMLVAGKAERVASVTALLELLAGKLWPLGEDPLRAAIAKIAGNMMLIAAIESMAEATALTRAHGLEAGDFLQIMSSTLFACPVYQNYGQSIVDQRFEPAGFAMALGHKDISLALAAGDAAKVPLPLASLLRDSLIEGLAAGEGALDLAGLSQVAARRAQLASR